MHGGDLDTSKIRNTSVFLKIRVVSWTTMSLKMTSEKTWQEEMRRDVVELRGGRREVESLSRLTI